MNWAFKQHSQVRAELRAAMRWYEGEREGLGSQFLAAVRDGIKAVRRSPRTWPHAPGTDDPAVHHYFLRRFPYRLVYTIEQSLIVLIAVAHLSREPRYWKARLRTRPGR